MTIDLNLLKQELQGGSGLIKTIRNKHLPNTEAMACMAQKRYEEQINDFSNIDSALDELLKIEYGVYLEKQKMITDSFIEYVDQEANMQEYPESRKIIDGYKLDIRNGVDPTKALTGITNIMTHLADSNRQSRVSRSGSSLMHHISYLLKKMGFEEQVDYIRECAINEKCRLDFFFPGVETYQNEPKNCCAVACQTTSNDRFRLAFAQVPANTRNRACTAIGSKNFGDKLGPQSLTEGKLKEAKGMGMKFVILESGLDQRLKNSQTVMSYQEWFKELSLLKPFWKR